MKTQQSDSHSSERISKQICSWGKVTVCLNSLVSPPPPTPSGPHKRRRGSVSFCSRCVGNGRADVGQMRPSTACLPSASSVRPDPGSALRGFPRGLFVLGSPHGCSNTHQPRKKNAFFFCVSELRGRPRRSRVGRSGYFWGRGGGGCGFSSHIVSGEVDTSLFLLSDCVPCGGHRDSPLIVAHQQLVCTPPSSKRRGQPV